MEERYSLQFHSGIISYNNRFHWNWSQSSRIPWVWKFSCFIFYLEQTHLSNGHCLARILFSGHCAARWHSEHAAATAQFIARPGPKPEELDILGHKSSGEWIPKLLFIHILECQPWEARMRGCVEGAVEASPERNFLEQCSLPPNFRSWFVSFLCIGENPRVSVISILEVSLTFLHTCILALVLHTDP